MRLRDCRITNGGPPPFPPNSSSIGGRRVEVARLPAGCDSAGLHVLVHDHALDLADLSVQAELERRGTDENFCSGSARVVDGVLSIVYKTAAEIGDLGDNTAVIRQAIIDDSLLAAALANERGRTLVLGHTRWASIGIISEPNAHPVNSELLDGTDHTWSLL